MKNIKIILCTALLAVTFISFPESANAGVFKSGNEAKGDFAKGAKLWANRCSSCHNLRDPKDLTDSEWEATITHMRIRAGLTGQDARDILEFLQKSN